MSAHRPALLALVLSVVGMTVAQAEEWTLHRPDNSGIPGEEIRDLGFAPDGDLWVTARWPFWGQGGIGRLDLETRSWDVLATVSGDLPTPVIHDVAHDPDGSYWVATDLGLVHQGPGVDEWFTVGNTPFFHNAIQEVEVGPDGRVWVINFRSSTPGSGVFVYDGANWEVFTVPEDLPWEAPWDDLEGLTVAPDGRVFVTNRVRPGMAVYDGTDWTLVGDDVFTFDDVTVDLDGNLWLITGGLSYDVYRYDGTSFVPFGGGTPPLSTTTITHVSVDPATGDVYIGNWMGEVVRTANGGASWELFGQVTSFVVGIGHDPASDDVWVGSQVAVHHFLGTGEHVQAWNTYNTGTPDYWVDYLNLGPDGNVWAASLEAGLSRFDGERWRNWGNHNAGSEAYAFVGNEPMGGMYVDRDGALWMGGNGIARYADLQGTEISGFWNWENNPGMGVTLFPYFAEGPGGRLFAVDEEGYTMYFDGTLWVHDPGVPPFGPNPVAGVEVDPDGNVWVCGIWSLHRWDGTSWTAHGDDLGLFDLGGASSFGIDPAGTLWIGTHDGLLRWDGVGAAERFTPDNSPLPAKQVRGLDVREDGALALATVEYQSTTPFPHGLAVVEGDPSNPGAWRVWHYQDSPLRHYDLGAVLWDADGRLWVSTVSEGLAVLDLGPVVGVEPGVGVVPGVSAWMTQNRPNPFRGSTTIGLTLPEASVVRLAVYDVTGRRVATLLDGRRDAGRHEIAVDGRGLTAGTYFYRLDTGSHSEVRRLTVLP